VLVEFDRGFGILDWEVSVGAVQYTYCNTYELGRKSHALLSMVWLNRYFEGSVMVAYARGAMVVVVVRCRVISAERRSAESMYRSMEVK